MHRPQRDEVVPLDDTSPVVVPRAAGPGNGEGDRRHNPRDIEVDRAAISHGIEHGGVQERRAEALATRGSGGRKRSGPRAKRAGRDLTKRR